MRTLYPRVRLAADNALELARRFARHRAIERALYPGLPDFPGHDIAARQMQGGFGGMLSIRIKGGEAAAIAAAGKLRVWKRATSLGGVESLVEHRASVEGPDTPCPRDLLRLSVGIENVEDLWNDFDRALGK
jgi:cystathionine gamma-synthase